MSLVCPYCEKQFPSAVGQGWNDCACEFCKRQFRALIAQVRAKRSKGDKKNDSRLVSVRLLYDGQEDFIEYDCGYANDFEMRAGDLVQFCYDREGMLCIVQNATLGRYTTIRRNRYNSLLWLFFAIFIILLIASFSH
jgi:hypothetical protein